MQCVKLPLLPQTVNALEPPAVLFAVETPSVEAPEPGTEAGLKLPLAPAGNPLTLNDTLLLKPFRAVTVTVYVVELPAFTVCDEGETEMVKSGIPFTIRVTVVECARVAVAPVMVSVYVPGTVVAEVETLSVEVPALFTEVGENDAVAPLGKPLTAKLIVPGLPPKAVAVTV